MAKRSGLGQACFVDGIDLSGDVGSFGRIGGGPAALEVTGVDKSAYERIGGLRDGAIEWSSWFNPAAAQAHQTLKTLPTTNRAVAVLIGTSLGDPSANIIAKQIGYDGTRAADGALTFALSAQANGFGVEWGRQHTAGKRSDTGAANGTGVDAGAASAFGVQVYFHVLSFTGTDITIKLQQSSDNAVGDPYADLTGATSGVLTTAPQALRVATSASLSVERWLRVVTTTSGGFSQCTFSVSVARNLTATAF